MKITVFGETMNLPYENIAYIDPLTQAWNRRIVYEALQTLIPRLGVKYQSRDKRESLAIAMTDLDGFKAVNDLYGHASGDAVLVEFVQRMRSNLREDDILIRYGGDEFLALLKIRPEAADSVISRILENVQKLPVQIRTLDGKTSKIYIKVSMGVCITPFNMITSQKVLDNMLVEADRLMYRTKFSIGPGFSIAFFGNGKFSESTPKEQNFFGGGNVPALEVLIDILHRSDGYARTYSYKSKSTMAKIITWGTKEGKDLFSRALPSLYERLCSDPWARKLAVDLATYHDIGNISIPPKILLLPHKISTESEAWETIKSHVQNGEKILTGILTRHYEKAKSLDSNTIVEMVSHAMEHHERWDGLGYPKGKSGENISELGRLMGVLSPFVSMSLPRIYAPAKPLSVIVEELQSFADIRYDPAVCALFEAFAKTLVGCSCPSYE